MIESLNITQLAKDRELKTFEIHQPNDFYGHATIIKKFAGYPNGYQLKAAIEHGVYLKPEGWDIDWKSPLPSIFTFSTFRHQHLERHTNKRFFAIGPYIHYAKPFLSDEEAKKEHCRLGKNLLVFPAHSTHWVNAEYNIRQYCQQLEEIGKNFNTIRICLYWKDILNGAAKIYGQHGFECVTAGHIYDNQFLPRLRSIIESATITTSNEISTAIGYCITLGKPHFLLESEVERTSQYRKFLEECVDYSTNIEAISIRKAFCAGLRSDITPDQIATVEKYWGKGEEKNTENIRNFLVQSENLFRRHLHNSYLNNNSTLNTNTSEIDDQSVNYSKSNCKIDMIWQVADHQLTGGAAIAGHRLFTGLKSAGAPVKLIPFNRLTEKDSACQNWEQISKAVRSDSATNKSIHRNYTNKEWFSCISAALDADLPKIINLHNIHEAVHYKNVPFDVLNLMAKKAQLVFTLHDMWLLTGRCAYNGSCRKFIDLSCDATCPTPSVYPEAMPANISKLLRTKIEIFQNNPDTVIVTPSKWLASQVKKSHLKNHRIDVIPYGIDTTIFKPDYDREELRESIGIPKNKLVLLVSAANLSDPRKGAQLLLKALSNINHELIVLTVGQSNLQPKLPSNIKFYNYGFVDSPEKMALAYSLADLFVCPSLEDNLPCVLIESISCGTPCVGFNIGGVPEVIRPNKTGWLASETTPEALSETIADLIINRQNLLDLRQSCRSVAKKEYDLNVQADRYIKLYNELLARDAADPRPHSSINKNRENKLNDAYENVKINIESGNIDTAKRELEALVSNNPQFAVAHNDLGVLLYQTGLKEKALEHYEEAVKLQPQNIVYLKNLADFYYVELGDIERAMQIYVRVLQIDSRDIETLLVVGHLCISIGNFQEAQDFYDKILEIDPEHQEARNFIKKLNDNRDRSIMSLKANEESCVSEPTKKFNFNSDDILISAIVSTYNAEKFIRGCLEDLESQTIADKIEIIVVNSGSNENEEAVVQEFQKKYENIKYIKTDKRETVYAAWNRGIKAASGKYITNANTDDRHRIDAFEIMVQTLEKYPDVALVYADVKITETENETFENCTQVGIYKWLEWNRDDLLYKGCFMGPQPMWRRDVHDEFGFFDDSLVTSGDYEFWLRISQTRSFRRIPQSLGLYLRTTDSIEHSNREKQLIENREILAMYISAHQNGKVIRRQNDELSNIDYDEMTEEKEQGKSNRYSDGNVNVSILLVEPSNRKKLHNCVDSLLKNTPGGYEITLISNLTRKKNSKLIKKLTHHKVPVKTITRKKYSSEYEAINKGIESSSGKFIVVISGEVTVFDGWLPSMKNCIIREENAGIIGPMSNHSASEKQIIGGSYRMIPDRKAFASTFMKKNNHRRIRAEWVDGSCLLFYKQIIDEIGNFDESLKDDVSGYKDFCLRAALAGYENFIAGDVFVYHKKKNNHSYNLSQYKNKWLGIDSNSNGGKKYVAQTHIRKGMSLYENGRLNDSVNAFLKAIGCSPSMPISYLKLADILTDAQKYKEALDVLEQIPSQSNDNRTYEIMLQCYEGLDRLEEAESFIQEHISHDNLSAGVLNIKGLIAHRKNDLSSSKEYFKHAIAADPGFGQPYSNLGVLKLEDSPKEGLKLIEKAFNLSASVSSILNITHEVLIELKEYQKGEMLFKEACELNPENKWLRYKLIDFLLRQEKHMEAMSQIETAISAFGIQDGILDVALSIREQLGPYKNGNRKRKPSVSLCMIVKNEEKYLAKCLQNIKPILNEIVIVDTGSSDRTKDLAIAYGANVYDFEWIDDFAAARNFSISKAKSDWIMVLDADEVISPKDFDKLRKILSDKSQKTSAYSLTTRNYCNKPNTVTWVPNDGFYPEEEKGFGWLPSEKVRIFRNKDAVKFEGAVHEMVDQVLKRKNKSVKKCSIPVHHYGTLNTKELDQKGRLYYNIGLKKIQENGNDINALREVAVQATELCENDEALRLWEKYLALKPDPHSTSEAFVNMGAIYMRMNDYDRALFAAENAVNSDPGLKEGHYNLAIATLFQGHPEKSIETLDNLIKWCGDYPPAHFFLAVSKCCAGLQNEGVKLFEKLKSTPLGPALSTTCVELCEKLLNAGRIQFVVNILQSAMEAKIISQGILELYSRCMDQFDKIPYSNIELKNEWDSIEHQGMSI